VSLSLTTLLALWSAGWRLAVRSIRNLELKLAVVGVMAKNHHPVKH
jgi:hypothetical protein